MIRQGRDNVTHVCLGDDVDDDDPDVNDTRNGRMMIEDELDVYTMSTGRRGRGKATRTGKSGDEDDGLGAVDVDATARFLPQAPPLYQHYELSTTVAETEAARRRQEFGTLNRQQRDQQQEQQPSQATTNVVGEEDEDVKVRRAWSYGSSTDSGRGADCSASSSSSSSSSSKSIPQSTSIGTAAAAAAAATTTTTAPATLPKPSATSTSVSSTTPTATSLQHQPSSSSTTTTPVGTALRRARLVAESHLAAQRSLWCELPEVSNSDWLASVDEPTRQLQEAYFEVVTSEASYLRSLNILITHFMASPLLGGKVNQNGLGTSGGHAGHGHCASGASLISAQERKHLFSNILAVRDCSERLLGELEQRLERSLLMEDLCDILAAHFEHGFDAYVKYCSNQVYQDRTLRALRTRNNAFQQLMHRLEADRLCQALDMRSFLMLPMQRVTRYPLLVLAIAERARTAKQRETAERAARAASRLVAACNEGARRMAATEQLLDIDRRLVYLDSSLRRVALVSAGRQLVKRGALLRVGGSGACGICAQFDYSGGTLLNVDVFSLSSTGTGTRHRQRQLYLFLFNDLLLVTKKKMNGTYVCVDYAERRFVEVEPVETDDLRLSSTPTHLLASMGASVLNSASAHLTGGHGGGGGGGGSGGGGGGGSTSTGSSHPQHLLHVVLMRNGRGRQSELLLAADSETDRERWLSAMRPPRAAHPDETVYADWDCPQAVAVHSFQAHQPDELSLEPGELVNILRKMPDGWFFGEKANSNSTTQKRATAAMPSQSGGGHQDHPVSGWFPSSYVQQILNDHVRAKHYRQRLRLIQAAAQSQSSFELAAAATATTSSSSTSNIITSCDYHPHYNSSALSTVPNPLLHCQNPPPPHPPPPTSSSAQQHLGSVLGAAVQQIGTPLLNRLRKFGAQQQFGGGGGGRMTAA